MTNLPLPAPAAGARFWGCGRWEEKLLIAGAGHHPGWAQGRGTFRRDLIPAAADQHLPRPTGAWKQTSRPPSLLPAQAEPMSIAHGRLAGGQAQQPRSSQLTWHSTDARTAGQYKVPEAWLTHQAGGRLAPRFPAKGTGAQGHTCEVRRTGTMYLSASANHPEVLAWPSMHGILASWAVLQVWRESDDVLPSRVQLLAAQMAPAQRTTCMHATPATPPPPPALARSLARPLARLSVSPLCDCLALSESLRLGSLWSIPHCRGFVKLRPSLARPQTRACLFSRSMAPLLFGILTLSARSPLSWWSVHQSPRLIIESLAAGSKICCLQLGMHRSIRPNHP